MLKFEKRNSKLAVRNVTPANAGVYGVEDCHPPASSGQGFRGDDLLRGFSIFGFRFSNFALRASIMSSGS